MININTILIKISKELATYLDNILKNHKSGQEWWNENVLNVLTHFQRRMIRERNILTLFDLDLSALLRIFDQNFWWLKEKQSLLVEHRNYIKEMQFIRNKWAHISSKNINDDDIYRELDTIERFLRIISVNNNIIDEVLLLKNEIIKMKFIEAKDSKKQNKFKIGMIVRLKSDKNKIGPIIDIQDNNSENIYTLFYETQKFQHYESQIELLEEDKENFNRISLSKFHAILTSELIKNPDLTKLYSLNSAKIDYIPYQFRPVLKFIKSDRPRLLIADSVGVGKTIEAGLILKEMTARQNIESVMIICPKALVVEDKWRKEMKRFDVDFKNLDGSSLHYCIDETDNDGVWPIEYNKSIIPYSILNEEFLTGKNFNKRKKRIGLLDLDPSPYFDLLIVDEAHYLRNTDTNRYKALEQLISMSNAVIFLTATPIQLGSNDLFVLLNLLRPDLIIDKSSFNQMMEPNKYLNNTIKIVRQNDIHWVESAKKELKYLDSTEWGRKNIINSPKLDNIYDLLNKKDITQNNKIEILLELEELKTFSNIINRTRRRDIGDFTIRKPFTVTNTFSESQKRLYDNILDLQSEIYRKFYQDSSINFLMTTIRRQASSSLFGLLPLIDNILKRNLDKSEIDFELDKNKLYLNLEKIEKKLENISMEIKSIDKFDSKLEKLLTVINDKEQMENNKIILFSSFRHTLFYLYENLKKKNIRAGLIYGDIKDSERVSLKERFQLLKNHENAIDILLFSEVGTEGLDYQFCNTMINYDLPWNPMKIEQRIGRLDRNGQESESIAIYNFITADTIDETIYERCFLRINIFEESIGENEQILGDITKEIRSIATDLKLTEDEKKERIEQLSDNKIRKIKEENKLENEESEFFGLELPHDKMEDDIKDATSYWLSSNSQENLIKEYFLEKFNENKFIIGDKNTKTLKISSENKIVLLKDFNSLNLKNKNSGINYKWSKWLKETSAYYKMTSEAKKSIKNPDYTFLTLSHPLLKQASSNLNSKSFQFIELFMDSKNLLNIKPGEYSFILYKWVYHGIKDDIKFQFICENEKIIEHYQEIILGSSEIKNSSFLPNEEFFNKLEEVHYRKWVNETSNHKEKVQQVINYRNNSLNLSHEAILSIVNEKLENASNEKIIKMYQYQKKNILADYERRVKSNDDSLIAADITFKALIYGVLRVR